MKALLTFLTLTLSLHLLAQIPRMISFQGVLTDTDNMALPDGEYELTFTLYEDANTDNAAWTETQNVSSTNGLINVILGEENALDIAFDRPYWLGIRVGNDDELTPRTALTAVPYALNSNFSLAPGTDVVATNENGDTTHVLYADGSAYHSGLVSHDKGLLVKMDGDTVVYLRNRDGYLYIGPDSLTQKSKENFSSLNIERLQSKEITVFNTESAALNAYSKSHAAIQGSSESFWGVSGGSKTSSGVVGSSGTSAGVYGQSNTGAALFGKSNNNYGVDATGGMGAALLRGDVRIVEDGKLMIDNVPESEAEKFLVWSPDKYVNWRTLPEPAQFTGALHDLTLSMWENGENTFNLFPNGEMLTNGPICIQTSDSPAFQVKDMVSGDPFFGINWVDTETGTTATFGVDKQDEFDVTAIFRGPILMGGDSSPDGEGEGGTLVIFEGSEPTEENQIAAVNVESDGMRTSFLANQKDNDMAMLVNGNANIWGNIKTNAIEVYHPVTGELVTSLNSGPPGSDPIPTFYTSGPAIFNGPIKLDQVPEATSNRLLIWDASNNNVGYKEMSSMGGDFNGLFNDFPLLMFDGNGEQTAEIQTNGHINCSSFLVEYPDGSWLFNINPSNQNEVFMNGDFYGSGTAEFNVISANMKNFLIDHPLDPENKTLRHFSIESDEVHNLYDGVVTLDQNGESWVQLPEWFEALNEDFSYQLTCIGGFANVYISEEIENNRFKIAGGHPGLKVSWQVTGVRHDTFVKENKLPVEAFKDNK